jgi:hypothetical protein
MNAADYLPMHWLLKHQSKYALSTKCFMGIELVTRKEGVYRVERRIALGEISDEAYDRLRPEFLRAVTLAEPELAGCAAPPKIDLHPTAVTRCTTAIEAVDRLLPPGGEPDPELASAFREFIYSVIVKPGIYRLIPGKA